MELTSTTLTIFQSMWGGAFIVFILLVAFAILKLLKFADAIYLELEKWKERKKVFQLYISLKIWILKTARHYLRKPKYVPKSNQPLKSFFLCVGYSILSIPFIIFYALILVGMIFNPSKVTFSLFCDAILITTLLIIWARGLAMAARKHFLSIR